MNEIPNKELTQKLVNSAIEASSASFSPLSRFPVGAALLVETPDGKQHIVQGTNYETQNYRSVCAEKHALQNAHLFHSCNGQAPKISQIAIYASKNLAPIFPCGDCRQALYEANPNLQVVSVGANGEIVKNSISSLLPHGFRLEESACEEVSLSSTNKNATQQEVVSSINQLSELTLSEKLKSYIVHFPVINERLPFLQNIESLIVVGSPIRAAKLAEHFKLFGDWGEAVVHNYCHIVSGETDREYSLFALEWPKLNFKIGLASHGIGASGIEIVLAEINALIALANKNPQPPLKAVIRSGTRGTIADVALGSIALTTKAYNETSENLPEPKLENIVRQAAEKAQIKLETGSCLSAQFFWSGQGRTAFPLLNNNEQQEEAQNDKHLRSLLQRGIKWIEMEDYYLNHFADKYKIAAASVGVVVAKRYDPQTDQFVLSYDASIKKDKELLPAELALIALRQYIKG